MTSPTRRATFAALAVGAIGVAPAAAAHPDARLIQLCGEFNALQREVERIHATQPARLTMMEERERDARLVAPIEDRQHVLLEEIETTPATTMAGVMARLEMVVCLSPHWAVYDEDDCCDERLIAAMFRDALALKAA